MRFVDPELVLFELQVCPSEYRFAVAPGQPLLFGYKEKGEQMPRTAMLSYEGNEQRFQTLLESLHWLVLANDIMDMSPSAPDRAFLPGPMDTASIHLRIEYADGRSWSSMYSIADAPPSVQALVDQSKYLGAQELKDAMSKPAPDAEAQGITGAGSADREKPVARLKLTLSGKVELDGKPVLPKELQEALRLLQRQQGEVWYYREQPEKPLPDELLPIGRFILDTVNALRLDMRICMEDFQ
jgi:hypothetical protein